MSVTNVFKKYLRLVGNRSLQLKMSNLFDFFSTIQGLSQKGTSSSDAL